MTDPEAHGRVFSVETGGGGAGRGSRLESLVVVSGSRQPEPAKRRWCSETPRRTIARTCPSPAAGYCREFRDLRNPCIDPTSTGADNLHQRIEEHAMNAPSTTEIPPPLVFTDSAANKVKQLIDEEGNSELKLRVFVSGGGCSGFQYGFTFDEVTNEDDTVMEKNGVMLLIDPMSYQYLVGAEIDYTEGLEGAQFVIKNPNATSTCGCGSSFSA